MFPLLDEPSEGVFRAKFFWVDDGNGVGVCVCVAELDFALVHLEEDQVVAQWM